MSVINPSQSRCCPSLAFSPVPSDQRPSQWSLWILDGVVLNCH
ncbi:hypothetical protein PJF56_19125 [Roseofilum sp. BLCC_M91]|uniref:Uncharacterized protein n=1 Tax=Roseofilum halophilum BLCC-M91 TaxID=3022259 RepID=A0ABT7BP48_9CYAN|nr:hypothetical protein [Roseofilum halophilum]MDJ1180976.1 hypothetical protein [Roseofilum halophilum BLCC-M91]